MVDESSVAWDPQYIGRELSISFKVYILFLLVTCVVACIKLIRTWRAALPFRLSRLADSPAHLRMLQQSSHSLVRWIQCTFIAWGLFAATTVSDLCHGMLNEKITGREVILFVIEDFSTALSMALWVVLFLFIVRWHMLARIERLQP